MASFLCGAAFPSILSVYERAPCRCWSRPDCCYLWQGGTERLYLLLLLLRGSRQQEVHGLKVCHHFGFKSGDIIFLLWALWISVKSKLKVLSPRVAVHWPPTSAPCPSFSVTQQEVVGYSVGHFISHTPLEECLNLPKCCTSMSEGLVQSISFASHSEARKGIFGTFLDRYDTTTIRTSQCWCHRFI